ncbi:MAG: hypothetical protein D3910_05105 [Candidatus Electrothrix sp. ATG2]|nr:hypothetical protein [Candidatus Electrothrix sp. ATG2]
MLSLSATKTGETISSKFIIIIPATSVLLLFTAQSSCANVGIPMVTVQLPFLIALLIPVVMIEAVLLRHHLGLGSRTAALISVRANLTSTVLGYPLSWVLHLLTALIVETLLSGFYEQNVLAGLNALDLFALSAFIPPAQEYEEKMFWLLNSLQESHKPFFKKRMP